MKNQAKEINYEEEIDEQKDIFNDSERINAIMTGESDGKESDDEDLQQDIEEIVEENEESEQEQEQKLKKKQQQQQKIKKMKKKKKKNKNKKKSQK